jgi:Carbohydrate family 9 binding domain-like
MAHTSRKLSWLILAIWLAGCTLPGAASPTPFSFPTPNLTLTAIFAPTASPASTTEAPPTPQVTNVVVQTTTPEVAGTQAASATLPATGDTRPNGLPVTADFVSTPPTIDGDLSDWTGNIFSANQIVFGASSWTGGADCSATYSIAWDSANLYLAIRVTDDRFVQISSGRTMYKGDGAEILLDTDLAGDFSTRPLSSDDYQIGLSPGNFGSLPPSAYRWFPASQESALASAEVKSVKTDAGYNLEVRLPWAVFGISPVSNRHYGFALSISDDDAPGTAVQQSMVSSVSTRILTDTTTWGTLVLGPPSGS